MKKLLALILALSVSSAYGAATVKRVCHEVKGKGVCKNVKVHKKFTGTRVPVKKKNK